MPNAECSPNRGAVPLGDTLEFVLGIDNDKLYLAAGAAPAKALKKIISQSKAAAGKEVPPLEMRIAPLSIAKFVTSHGPMAMMMPGAAGAIKSSEDGKDHIVITAKTIYHGVRYRIEIEEGLVKLLNSVPMGPPGGMPPGGMPPGGEPPPGGPTPMSPPTIPPLPRPGG